MMTYDKEMAARWRLILGQFAEESLPLDGQDGDTEETLSFLYDREYGEGRGVSSEDLRGGTGKSVFIVPEWISKVRTLFPKRASDIMQKDALNRYGIDEMLTDPEILQSLEPDITLLGKLLSFRSIIPDRVKKQADDIIRRATEEISKKLESEVKRCFYGKKLSSAQTYYKVYRNFDFKRTVERNLKNYSPEYKTVIPSKLYFRNTVKCYNPWDVIILCDQSGSMCNSVIYSAVMTGIFAKMPFLRTRIAVFDTSIADLSDYADNAAELLMKVLLGGGTDIYKALCYAESIITSPAKTIVILISDLYDNQDMKRFIRKGADIMESGSRLIVLPALDYESEPSYNRPAAKVLAQLGANVAAVTPEELAEWIGNIIS